MTENTNNPPAPPATPAPPVNPTNLSADTEDSFNWRCPGGCRPKKDCQSRSEGDCKGYDCSLLEVVRIAASELLGSDDWSEKIGTVLELLGDTVDVCRVRLFDLRTSIDGDIAAIPSHSWARRGCKRNSSVDVPEVVDYEALGLQRWRDTMLGGEVLVARDDKCDEAELDYMKKFGLSSFILVPVEAGGRLWGGIGFASCSDSRQWTDREKDLLKTVAKIVGAAVEQGRHEAQSRQNESLFRSLIHNLPVGLVRALPQQDSRIIMANPAVADIFGYTDASQMMNLPVSRLFEDPDSWLDALVGSMSGGGVRSREYTCFKITGDRIWISLTTSLVRDMTGQSAFIEMVLEDVTQRRNAENELRISENKYRNLIELQTDLVIRLNLERKLTFVNESFSAAMGKTATEMIGDSVIQYVHQEDRMALAAAVDRALNSGTKSTIRLRVETALGWRWMDWEGYLISAVDQAESEFQAVGRDVTEQVLIEEALENERAHLRTVLDTIPDSVYLKDLDGKLLVVNHSFVEGMERPEFKTPADYTGLTDYDLFGQEVGDRYRQMDLEVMAHGKLVRQDNHKYDEDGKDVWLEYYLAPLWDAGENITGMVGIVKDVTSLRESDKAIRRERTILRTVLDALPDAVYLKDKDGRFLVVNNTFQNTVAMKSAAGRDLIGLTDYDLYDKDRADKFRLEDLDVMVGHPVIAREQDKKIVNGKALWLQYDIQSLSDEDGELMGLVGVIRDITSLKMVEEKIRHERQLLRTIIDGIPNYVYMKDVEGRFVLANESFVMARGLECEDDILGRTDADFQPPERREHCRRCDAELLEQGKVIVNRERVWMNAEGQLCCHIFSSAPIRDTEGDIIGLIGIITDLSELRRAEEAVRESQARYQEMVESLPVGVCRLDIDSGWLVTMANTAAASMFGYDKLGEFIGVELGTLAMNTHMVDQLRTQLLDEGKLSAVTIEMPRPEGKAWWLLFTSVLQLGQDGKPSCVDIVMEDITDRRQSEKDLQRAHNELVNAREVERRRLAAELHDSLGQTIVALHMTIQGLSKAAEQTGMNATALVQPIRDAAGRCGDMVREVRQICHGLYPTVLVTLGLEAALRSLARDFASSIGVTLEYDPALAGLRLPEELEIAMFRIAQESVSNAVRHGEAEDVFIALEYEDHVLKMVVQDNGAGFDLDRVTGGGLGLKSMRERASATGGRLDIDSTKGEGAVVILTIPDIDIGPEAK